VSSILEPNDDKIPTIDPQVTHQEPGRSFANVRKRLAGMLKLLAKLRRKHTWITSPWALLTVAPLITFFVLWIAASIVGVATAPNCDLASVAISFLDTVANAPAESDCRAVPLLSDLPSLALAITSTMAVAGYLVMRRKLDTLPHDLYQTGLFEQRADEMPELRTELDRFKNRGRFLLHGGRRLVYALILGVGIYMYYVTVDHGQIFDDLARISGADSQVFRDNWWANVNKHPLLAMSWIVIGTAGAIYAAKAAFVYFGVFVLLRNVDAKLQVRALTLWEDAHLGWRPVKTVLALVYVGSVNFVVSFISVLYILQRTGGRTGDYVLAIFALIGVSANVALLTKFVVIIRRTHIAAVDRDLNDIARLLNGDDLTDTRNGSFSDAALLVKASQLQEVRRYPLQGKARLLITLVPGIAASGKLVNDAIALLTG
jgi:hypothetical protein